MHKQAKRINQEQAEILRQVGMGDRIEERLYLLPEGVKPKKKAFSGKRRGATSGINTKLRARTQVVLTGKKMSEHTVKGSRIDVVFNDARRILHAAQETGAKITRTQIAQACKIGSPFTYNTVTTSITHLIRGGYIRYVDSPDV